MTKSIPPLRTPMLAAVLGTILVTAGCGLAPSGQTFSRNYSYGDTQVDPPSDCVDGGKFDDHTRGGQLFKYYCGTCHNARALGERPFSNYHVALAHMREQAYLTGKEYRELMHFLRRWQDVGPPTPDMNPSPKRFIYSQPIGELRPKEQESAPQPLPIPKAAQPDGGETSAAPGPGVIWNAPPNGAEAPRAP